LLLVIGKLYPLVPLVSLDCDHVPCKNVNYLAMRRFPKSRKLTTQHVCMCVDCCLMVDSVFHARNCGMLQAFVYLVPGE
jgi:hypothetical protein